MKVNDDARPKASPIPGIAHITLASQADGLSELSVWRQSMSPGAATPPHHHDCDEVVLCLALFVVSALYIRSRLASVGDSQQKAEQA